MSTIATTAGAADRSAQRRTTRKAGRLPDFLIIGAAKSGTTTVYRHLRRHPGIFMCRPKEPEYFSDDRVFRRGEAWYKGLFREARPAQICGEASTTYTRWPHTADAAGRIAAALPHARLIYIMRHPVERAYSHYAHHMRYGVTETFEQALQRDSIYVDCGMYIDQLQRYLAHFPQSQVLCLLLDDLRDDRSGTLADVQRFLGLEPHPAVSEDRVVANATKAEYFIKHRTTDRLLQIPGMASMVRLVPKRVRGAAFGVVRRSPLGRRLEASYRLPPMQPQTRRQLLEHFAEPTRRLERFLGRDLSTWCQ